METELENSKRLALEVKQQIDTASHAERIEMLEEFYSKWIIKSNHRNNMFDYLKLAIYNFGIGDTNDLQIGTFIRYKQTVEFKLQYLKYFLVDSTEDQEEKDFYIEKINKLMKAIVDADNAVQSSLYLKSSMTQEDIGVDNAKQELFRFNELDYEGANSYQSLLLFLFEKLRRKQYRRYVVDGQGVCYKKIYNKNGHDTHAWKQAMSVEEFVIDCTRKDINPKMWFNKTASAQNTRNATVELTKMLDPSFDDLVRDRHVFSFNNGIYITKHWDEEQEKFIDQWIPYEGPKSKKIGESIVSCKLFDLNFDDKDYDDWFDIVRENCPNFLHIMTYQRWPEDVQRWLCILIGRMLYDVREFDDWQVIPYLLGQAGSGKCMGINTPIIMADGTTKTIQNIKVGDKLMGDDSKPRTVLSTTTGKAPLYRVKQNRGDDYVVNGAHILSLKMTYTNQKTKIGDKEAQRCENRIINGKKYKVGDIVDISVDDYLKISESAKKALKGYKVGITFPEKEVPLDPYLLGLWLGDGHSAGSRFTGQDSTVLKHLANELPTIDCYLQFQKNTSGYSYRFNGNGSGKDNFFSKTLRDLNLINNKHIPAIYKFNSRENQLKLLAGLLDTDGHYQTGCYDFVQKNYKIAKGVEYIARCLGFTSTVVECQKSCMYKGEKITGTYYRQCISGNGLEEIPCKIKRKQATSRKQIKNNLYTGITVEPVEQEFYDQGPGYDSYYGFQIDGNQRFLLGDHTVTHNSTILDYIVRELYETADVGILGNNIEHKFGLSSLIDKKIFIGPEIKGNLGLEQAEFQSMISGEMLQVNVKFKQAYAKRFTAAGMLAGNEVPNYSDNSGSFSRRVVVFPFNYPPIKKDQSLGKKIGKELAHIIRASNKGYLKTLEETGTVGIWEILPDLFKETKKEMASNTNALTNFLNSELVTLDSKLYIPEKQFVTAFNDHCKENHLGTYKWTSQYYQGSFSQNGIYVKKDIRRRYPNKPGERVHIGNFIFGVDLRNSLPVKASSEDDSEEEEDYDL